MKKVLVAVDGSAHAEAAVRWLVAEAQSGGKLFAHVLNVQPAAIGYQTHGMETEAIATLAQQRGLETLQATTRLLDEAKVPYEREVVQGEPWDAIVDRAKKTGCDAIVMGRRGLGAVSGLFLGSVATKVLHLSDSPVVLVR
jgi:nucleotide-binding universal stress UspA family protein